MPGIWWWWLFTAHKESSLARHLLGTPWNHGDTLGHLGTTVTPWTPWDTFWVPWGSCGVTLLGTWKHPKAPLIVFVNILDSLYHTNRTEVLKSAFCCSDWVHFILYTVLVEIIMCALYFMLIYLRSLYALYPINCSSCDHYVHAPKAIPYSVIPSKCIQFVHCALVVADTLVF